MHKTLQEGIAIAAKAVERSIQDGQPVGLVDTKPVTDLLNEVGTGQWQMVESPGELSREPPPCKHAKLTAHTSQDCCALRMMPEVFERCNIDFNFCRC